MSPSEVTRVFVAKAGVAIGPTPAEVEFVSPAKLEAVTVTVIVSPTSLAVSV
jgi:hypothetical protein